MQKYLAELIGIFFLVFFGTGAVVISHIVGNQQTRIPVAIPASFEIRDAGVL